MNEESQIDHLHSTLNQVLYDLDVIKNNTKKPLSWLLAIPIAAVLAASLPFLKDMEIPYLSTTLKTVISVENKWADKAGRYLSKEIAEWQNGVLISTNPAPTQPLSVDGVHPDIMAVYQRAQELTPFNIHIREGLRDIGTQRHYVRIGASKTLNSRHLTGHALDLEVKYSGRKSNKKDWYWCRKINKAMQKAAKELGVPIVWGGHWKSFPDGYHYQLAWKSYPKNQYIVKARPKKLKKSQSMLAKIKSYFNPPRKKAAPVPIITDQQWQQYALLLRCHESKQERTLQQCLDNKGGHYPEMNGHYYLGAYQMSASALCDAGEIKQAYCNSMWQCSKKGAPKTKNCTIWKSVGAGIQPWHGQFLKNSENWNSSNAIQFLKTPGQQDKAFKKYTLINIKRGFEKGALDGNSTIREILGYAAGAHLKGHTAAFNYVVNQQDDYDRNGTKVSYYVKSAMNYIN